MSVFSLALAGAFGAIAKIILIFAVGIMSAHYGYLSPTFIPQLSNFSFTVTMPSLIIVSLAKQVTIETLSQYWNILVWGIINILSCYVVAFLYIFIASPRKEYHKTIVTAIAYPNTVAMGLAIFDSLCLSPLFEYVAPTFAEVYAVAVLMVFIYSIPWSLLFFIIGFPHMMGIKREQDHNTIGNEKNSVKTPLQLSNGFIQQDLINNQSTYPTKNNPIQSLLPIDHNENKNNPIDHMALYTPDPLDLADIDEDPRYRSPIFLRGVSHCTDIIGICFNYFSSIFHFLFGFLPLGIRSVAVMTLTSIPTMSTFIGIGIGCIPQLKHPCFSHDGYLRPFTKALEFISQITVPTGTIITAANIYHSINRNFGRDARIFQRYQTSLEKKLEYEKFCQNRTFSLSIDSINENNSQILSINQPLISNTGKNRENNNSLEENLLFLSESGDSTFSPQFLPTVPVNSSLKYDSSVPQSDVKENTSILALGITIEYDENGEILPLPRLPLLQMLAIALIRLLVCPAITFGCMILCDHLKWTVLLPHDTLYRANIMIASCSTSAEMVLMLVTKTYQFRQSFMLSLIYLFQYLLCLLTVPMWIVLAITYTPVT